jgi:hypothetical protein
MEWVFMEWVFLWNGLKPIPIQQCHDLPPDKSGGLKWQNAFGFSQNICVKQIQIGQQILVWNGLKPIPIQSKHPRIDLPPDLSGGLKWQKAFGFSQNLCVIQIQIGQQILRLHL